jgi:hypothetical protein
MGLRCVGWIIMLVPTLLMSIAYPANAQDAGRGFRIGRYEGTAFNTTVNHSGKAVFEILSVDRSGAASAHFVASDGLFGEAWLTGTATGNEGMQLAGKLAEFDMTLRAVPASDGGIVATYQLRGPSSQDGTFKVGFRSAMGPILAPGTPPLMQSTADRYIAAYEVMFDLHLLPAERGHIEQQMIASWRNNDRGVIDRVLDDVQAVGGKTREELRSNLGPDYQTTLVEAARRGSGRNPVMDLLVAAFDHAHPERIQDTRARGLADLTGTWKKFDYLVPPSNLITHLPAGPSWQDGGTLVIEPAGRFSLNHVHNHCDNSPGRNCCRIDGYNWNGTLAIEQGNLAFDIASGGTTHQDNCAPSMNRNTMVSPHKETATWTLRQNPAHDDAPALCLHPTSGEEGCYTKE